MIHSLKVGDPIRVALASEKNNIEVGVLKIQSRFAESGNSWKFIVI